MVILVSSCRLLTAESPVASATMRPAGRDFSSWLSLVLSLRESCVSKRSLHTTSAVSWSTTRRLIPRLKFFWKPWSPVDKPEAGTVRVEEGPGQSLWPWSSRVSSGIHTQKLAAHPGTSVTVVSSDGPDQGDGSQGAIAAFGAPIWRAPPSSIKMWRVRSVMFLEPFLSSAKTTEPIIKWMTSAQRWDLNPK